MTFDSPRTMLEHKYLELLSEQFPTQHAVFTEIINLQAILNLPKATEHFISDVHGEYEAFAHILNNCSGVIRDRVNTVLGDSLTDEQIDDLCTLIYYPREKLAAAHAQGIDTTEWYQDSLMSLIRLARFLSNYYTRSKVRRAMPVSYAYIIEELLHEAGAKAPERHDYHVRIITSIIETGAAEDFICSLAALIKRLAVDHLHVVGDLWDRGPHGDRVMDQLMAYHSLDIQWGNHDLAWMGACAGSAACVASVVRTNVRNNTIDILEGSYGISLRQLALFAERTYQEDDVVSPLEKAISAIYYKLEGQLIDRRPEFGMADRKLLERLDLVRGTLSEGGRDWPLVTCDFPTVDPDHPYRLTPEEEELVDGLVAAFHDSQRLRGQIDFLYESGSMYKVYNDMLLFHGCIPMKEDGTFAAVRCSGEYLSGKRYLDFCDAIARRAWYEGDEEALDWMLFLSCGQLSPASGRLMKTFERSYVEEGAVWEEPQDPYWRLANDPRICDMILKEFGVSPSFGHIVNGHTPVKARSGESPVRADGKFLVIDGGFCRKYQPKTGIAGYTLISDDRGIRIKAHLPFESVEAAVSRNADISEESVTEIARYDRRLHISDTDIGDHLREQIRDLQALLDAYRTGEIVEHSTRA
ncbi:MAG: fructose-1,6-bisphosphatase [Atopobiaceae bacterium]|nr:fructose-1,6-bisphosphatase [Atopobiaceae bacterium]MCI1388323.1 fructose-1,6-bisphosphatase [Atopobiaceae bacterium]